MSFACVYIEDKTITPSSVDIFTVDMNRIGFIAPDMELVSKGQASYRSHIIALDPTRKYMVGVDQSTTSTGIAVATENFDYVVVITTIAGDNTILGRERHTEQFLEFLYEMLLGKDFHFVASEAVPPQKGVGSFRTWEVLTRLKSRLKATFDRVPTIASLSKALRPNPLPQQWKATIYDKKSAAGKHFNNKAELARDICRLYPALDAYREVLAKTYGHDYDGFDAFGILTHVRLKHFGPEWESILQEEHVQKGMFHVFMKYLAGDGMEFAKEFMPWSTLKNPEGKVLDKVDAGVWNRDVSAFSNLIMMANSDKIMLTECKNTKFTLAYLVETGEPYDKEKSLWIAVCKDSLKLLNKSHIIAFQERCGFLYHRYYKGVKYDGIT